MKVLNLKSQRGCLTQKNRLRHQTVKRLPFFVLLKDPKCTDVMKEQIEHYGAVCFICHVADFFAVPKIKKRLQNLNGIAVEASCKVGMEK